MRTLVIALFCLSNFSYSYASNADSLETQYLSLPDRGFVDIQDVRFAYIVEAPVAQKNSVLSPTDLVSAKTFRIGYWTFNDPSQFELKNVTGDASEKCAQIGQSESLSQLKALSAEYSSSFRAELIKTYANENGYAGLNQIYLCSVTVLGQKNGKLGPVSP